MWCFCSHYFVSKKKVRYLTILGIVLIGINFISRLISVHIVSYVLENLVFLYAGFVLSIINKKHDILKKGLCWKFVCSLGIFFISIVLLKELREASVFIEQSFRIILGLSGLYATYFVAEFLTGLKFFSQLTPMKIVRSYSYELYLYSDPWNYVILFLSIRIFGSVIFENNAAYFCLTIFRLFFASLISIVIGRIVKRTKKALMVFET